MLRNTCIINIHVMLSIVSQRVEFLMVYAWLVYLVVIIVQINTLFMFD